MHGEKEPRKDTLSKFRENPWILSTIALGFVLIFFIFVGQAKSGSDFSNQDVVEEKVMGFLSSQVNGEVSLNSIENKGSFYEVVVEYQGDKVPIFSDLNGNYIFTDLIPIDSKLPTTGPVNGAENSVVEVETGDSYFKGDENAPVTIIEFSDYQCPFCAKFYTESLQLIQKNYIDTGKVRLVFRDFPLSFHSEAQKAAEAARCFAEQGLDYFVFHDKLFENQHLLDKDVYKLWAIELGANGNKFQECLDSGRYYQDVQEDLTYGASVGVTGTPGFFVNGISISGAQPYSVFEQIIEAELSKV